MDILYRIRGYGFDSNMNLIDADLPFVFRDEDVAKEYLTKMSRIAKKLRAFYEQKRYDSRGMEAIKWRDKADRVAPYAGRAWVDKVEVR